MHLVMSPLARNSLESALRVVVGLIGGMLDVAAVDDNHPGIWWERRPLPLQNVSPIGPLPTFWATNLAPKSSFSIDQAWRSERRNVWCRCCQAFYFNQAGLRTWPLCQC